jgi:hypothetical protein
MSNTTYAVKNPIMDFWKNKINPKQKLYYHSADEEALITKPVSDLSDDERVLHYLENKKDPKNKAQPAFDLSILPSPYNGDLAQAKIFILMLNPGLSWTDYYIAPNETFKRESLAIINQEGMNQAFPFSCLNPEFYYWSGFQYWHSKLGPVIQRLHQEKKFPTYEEALSFVAKNIATVQYVAYHSRNFESRQARLSEKLQSNQDVLQDYVQELVKRAKAKEIILLSGCSVKRWQALKGYSANKNASGHIYTNKSSRGFHLSTVMAG